MARYRETARTALHPARRIRVSSRTARLKERANWASRMARPLKALLRPACPTAMASTCIKVRWNGPSTFDLSAAKCSTPWAGNCTDFPKILRVFFRHDRKLYGEISRLIYRIIQTFYNAAAGTKIHSGAVIAYASAGEFARFNPHIHAIQGMEGAAQTAIHSARWRGASGQP